MQADRCIEAGDASMVVENAGPSKALKEFFSSDEVRPASLLSPPSLCLYVSLSSFSLSLSLSRGGHASPGNQESPRARPPVVGRGLGFGGHGFGLSAECARTGGDTDRPVDLPCENASRGW